MTSQQLYNAAYYKAGKIANRVVRRFHGKVPSYEDYPAIVVSSAIRDTQFHSEQHSRSCHKYRYDTRILSLLNKIGHIDGKSNVRDCGNLVGHCAEPHAANEVIKKNARWRVEDLMFSPAIRPRTRQIKPYCGNCKATFKQL